MSTQETGLSVIDESKKKFELACKDAASLQIVNNFGAAFTAVNVIALLREALTDEVMNKVFMPLMNTKVGFLTDRNGRPRSGGRPALPVYSVPVVRDAIIDAVSIGLLPTGNQFNIIAERMYPTKEGYTALPVGLGLNTSSTCPTTRAKTETSPKYPAKSITNTTAKKTVSASLQPSRKTNTAAPTN